MKKRLAIIGLVLAVAVGVGAVVYWALTPTPGVTVENFKRLRSGMSESQVAAILGQRGESCEVTLTNFYDPLGFQRRWANHNFTIELLFQGEWDGVRIRDVVTIGRCVERSGRVIDLDWSVLDDVRKWLGI